ncbi:hypothetical protein DPMN_106564 [Dreissena polymorpha]|uniref:Uncharacterized protein n=1 Tax=Dreissena polymorpha TaxID=45954 RepID=A0A9D4K5D6_DREPO|nr:hypothetical protein DPMN_106564 [Dreissena polymorpha]
MFTLNGITNKTVIFGYASNTCNNKYNKITLKRCLPRGSNTGPRRACQGVPIQDLVGPAKGFQYTTSLGLPRGSNTGPRRACQRVPIQDLVGPAKGFQYRTS